MNSGIVGAVPCAVLKNVETVARLNPRAESRGETGTGKELIARVLHDLSR